MHRAEKAAIKSVSLQCVGWAIVFTLVILTSSCASSTQRFEPQRQIKDLAAEQYKQSGLPEIYNGMDCLKYHEAMLEICYASWDCTARQERQIKRDILRVRRFNVRRCFFSFRR